MIQIGGVLIVIIALIILIWVFVEIKRAKHKFFAIFLIFLVLFGYFSVKTAFNEKEVDFKSVNGIMHAFQVYFSWLGTFFSNIKTITSNVIKMDWKGNSTAK